MTGAGGGALLGARAGAALAKRSGGALLAAVLLLESSG
jgi:hypothetical protein